MALEKWIAAIEVGRFCAYFIDARVPDFRFQRHPEFAARSRSFIQAMTPTYLSRSPQRSARSGAL